MSVERVSRLDKSTMGTSIFQSSVGLGGFFLAGLMH